MPVALDRLGSPILSVCIVLSYGQALNRGHGAKNYIICLTIMSNCDSMSLNNVGIYMKKEMWMEDVLSIAVNADELIENQLKEFGITLTDEQEDEIHNAIWKVLEGVSNGEYRHHN
jgi:hypothetical protein